ncbi:OmpP1/FadL family transporter [Christiangramia sp. ASW11-125]|uniref:OmpP1/FadL family transporter n=1 Tax=Christiangramia sp. ASW11-125 TaxID=3400701 RepID=UPI003AAE7CC2
MNKIFLIFLLAFAGNLWSQSIDDAYRYSRSELNGTARYIGMSGAFGALGGDISAISSNPASSAVFLNSIATISLKSRNTDDNLRYHGSTSYSKSDEIDLGNVGGVFVFQGSSDKKLSKFSLGLNFNTTSNFDNNFVTGGISRQSVDTYFLQKANGIPLDQLQLRDDESIADLYSFLGENFGFDEQQAFLGYQGYVIEASQDNPNNTEYFSLVEDGSFDQQYRYNTTGLNGKLSFNIATQYEDWLYLGLNLNSHFINYDKFTEISELHSNTSNDPNATSRIDFGNNLRTNGDGFSFQLGAIAKAGDYVRLGYTYQSPTWFNMFEETSQYLETYSSTGEFVSVSPNIINVYPEYNFQTPSTHTGSVAFLFGKSGLISGDLSLTDYGNVQFKPKNDLFFQNLNDAISETMKMAPAFKVGGEYRLKALSFRAGYRYEASPFENEEIRSDLNGYSAGLGYNFGSVNLDIAYETSNYEEQIRPLNSGVLNPVSLDRDLSQFVATLTIGL